jgi:hypothetical protein
MKSFWSEPFLWIHLAGAAILPILFEICLLGLATGEPYWSAWLELLAIAAIGILPILWMQWTRPFDIFSLLFIALDPEQLTLEQRRLLSQFKSNRNRILTSIGVGLSLIFLWFAYRWAPAAATVTPFPAEWRFVGLGVATLAFLASNLFLQVPLSVIGILLTDESSLTDTEPYPVERIRQDFTLVGLRVERILPSMLRER